MAKRLSSTFVDEQAQTWTLELYDDDFTGSSSSFRTMRGSIVLQWDSPEDETHAWALPSSLAFTIFEDSTEVTDYLTAIPSRAESDLIVKLYKGAALEWLGIVLPDSIERPLDNGTPTVSIQATDGLGLLSRKRYANTDGTALSGFDRITGHLLTLLNLLPTSSALNGAPFLFIADHVRPQQASGAAPNNYTYNTRVEHEAFYDIDEETGTITFQNGDEVGQQLALLFGARLFFQSGAWYFLPPYSYLSSTTPTLYGFENDGTVVSTPPSIPTPINLDTVGEKENGWLRRLAPPCRAVYRGQYYRGNLPLYEDSNFDETEFFTTHISPTGFVYPAGTRFSVTGTLRVTMTQNSSLSGSSQVVRWQLGVLLTIPGEQVGGTRYWVAQAPAPTLAYDTESVFVSNTNGYQPIFAPTETPVGSWTNSPGSDYWTVWTEPQVAGGSDSATTQLVFPFSFTTADSVTNGQNLTVRVVLYGWTGWHNGQSNTATATNSSTYLGGSDYHIDNLRVIYGDIGDDNGNVARYGSQVSSASDLVEELVLPRSVLGDVLTPNTSGRTQSYFSGWANTTGWTSPQTTSPLRINKLLTKERLLLRATALESFTGVLHQLDYFTPAVLLADDSDSYVQTSHTRVIDLATSDVTAYKLEDNAVPTEDTDDNGDPQPHSPEDADPVDNDPDGDGIIGELSVKSVSGSGPTISPTEVGKLTNITVTQAVDLDAIESLQNTHEGEITSLQSFQTTVGDVLKTAFTGGGAGVYADSAKGTGQSFMGLTSSSAKLQAGANTLVDITETSPGTIDLTVATDSAGSTAFTAVAIEGQTSASTATVSIANGATLRINGASGYAALLHTGTNVQISLPTSSGTLARTADLYTNSDADARIALAELSDLANVNAPSPTNGDVLTWDTSASRWVSSAGGGGGSDSFTTISVGGQSDVVADSGSDTLTLAAGTNLAITTNASTDTITFTPSLTPTFTSATVAILSTSVGIVNSGTLSAGNTTINGTITSGAISSSAAISCSALNFAGSGTSTIAPVGSGAAFPDDLELRSNGNITLVLDYDSDEAAQAFIVKNQAGTVIFQVNEDGVSSGLLTTPAPTISGLSSTAQQGSSAACTVSTAVAGRSFVGAIYNSSGVEQTSNPVTIDSSGNVSFTAPSTIATGYELRIYAIDAGKLRSGEDVETFEVTASRTFTYWRVRVVDSSGNNSSNKAAWVELDFYPQVNQGGTPEPQSGGGHTISAGQYYGTYSPGRAFDGTTHGTQAAGSMWWTLSGNATNNWIQVQFTTAQTFASLRLTVYDSFNDATHLHIEGSNTGSFTGEQVIFGQTAITETGAAGITNLNF